MLGTATNLGRAECLCGKLSSSVIFPSTSTAGRSETIAELRRNSVDLNSRALWLQAEEVGLQARSRCKEGSAEWAEITLIHCAQARQQAGDISQAQAYIEQVIQHSIKAAEQPDPHIIGLIYLHRGWIACEQTGQFEQGYYYFNRTLQETHQIGDTYTKRTAHHFRLRLLSELAMREGNAWLGARPTRSISQQLLQQLHQSLEIDWPLSCDNDPESLHALNRRYMVYTLIRPDKALKELSKLLSISRDLGAEHVVDLDIARWHLSNGEWDSASSLAQAAFQGYYKAAFPPGIALAAAVRAEALFQNQLRSKVDCILCLDLWLLTLLLHPYQSHPLWDIAYKGLHKTKKFVFMFNAFWFHGYYQEINARVECREDIFHALRYLYFNRNKMLPTQYLDLPSTI
jgi:tetratricopeptide (TPR) repeat protein